MPQVNIAASAKCLPRALRSKHYIHSEIQATIESQSSYDSTTAVPVVVLSRENFSSTSAATETLHCLLQQDDVLTKDFLTSTVVLRGESSGNDAQQSSMVLSTTLGSWDIKTVLSLKNDEILPEGPYFLLGNGIHQAWRLYPDYVDAFVTTIVPHFTESAKYSVLDAVSGDGLWRAVAVPSRLYSVWSKDKPLAGKRITIKDNYRLEGIITTLSNRAFVETYGPEETTAEYVKKLVSLGAIVVGKTKLCAFASSEAVTDQWIDFHAPFNPRADGYQDPAGSTTGGATSMAAYDWLDCSVGTDTSGSIRWPAAWNGVFGLRATSNAASLSGVYAACREMDTVGLLGRDLAALHEVAKLTLNTLGDISEYPRKILYSTDFFPHSNPEQQAIIDEYVTILEDVLGCRRTEINIADQWSQSPPSEANGKSLREYIEKTAYYPFYWDGYHEFSQFREDYRKKFDKNVYVGPYMRWKWDVGAKVTEAQVEKALKELQVYRQWFHDTILHPDEGTGSSAILILPCGSGEPKYRDDQNKPPAPVSAYSMNYIASMIGLPQLVRPVGQVPFDSRVSGRKEHLPVVGTMVGARGSDLMLFNLAKAALDKAKWPAKVATGRYTFKLGDGTRNVASDLENQDHRL